MSVTAAATCVQLHLGEMSCPWCATDIDRHLRRLPGVQAVRIDVDTRRVEVDYDPQHLDVKDILVTAGGAGVTATVASQDR